MEWQTQSTAFAAISTARGCGFQIYIFCAQIALLARSCIGKPDEWVWAVPKLCVLMPSLSRLEEAVGGELCPCYFWALDIVLENQIS